MNNTPPENWIGDIFNAHGSVKTGNSVVVLNGFLHTLGGKKPVSGLSGVFKDHVVGEAQILEQQNPSRPAVGIYQAL